MAESEGLRLKNPDDALIPQVELPTKWSLRLGGLIEIGLQSLGVLAVPNGVMIALTWYRGSDVIQSVFPSALAFMATYIGLGLLGFVGWLAIVYPARQKFILYQSDQEDRSPGYAKALEIEAKLEQLADAQGIDLEDANAEVDAD